MSAVEFDVGARLRLSGARPFQWWIVQAVSPHFTAVVRQVPFEEKGTLEYTVLDWRNGIRGPCNLIGQGYGDGEYTPTECAEMLEEFENTFREDPAMVAALADGHKTWHPSFRTLEVSHRNSVPLQVIEVEGVESLHALLVKQELGVKA